MWLFLFVRVDAVLTTSSARATGSEAGVITSGAELAASQIKETHERGFVCPSGTRDIYHMLERDLRCAERERARVREVWVVWR